MDLSFDALRRHPGGLRVGAAFSLGGPGVTVLFGPSGCGKTTLLRALAGLDPLEEGRLVVDGSDWTRRPAHRRGFGCVFQEEALFPHLTVAANVGFGVARRERAARVAPLLDAFGLDDLAHRRPSALSGGQRQRVALARALAIRPRLLLLDEPFSSLDRTAARSLYPVLRNQLEDLGIPALLVTHDPLEALSLGDRVLRMEGGVLVQDGPPAEVLGQVLGSIVTGQVVGRREGLLEVAVGGVVLVAPDPGEAVPGEAVPGRADPGGTVDRVRLCIRPEGVSLESVEPAHQSPRNRLVARIVRIQEEGVLTRVHLDAGFPLEALVTTWARQDLDLQEGRIVWALVKASALQVVPL